MSFKGDYILDLDVCAHKSLGLFCIKKLQRDNLWHAYNEPINIYSVCIIKFIIERLALLWKFEIHVATLKGFNNMYNECCLNTPNYICVWLTIWIIFDEAFNGSFLVRSLKNCSSWLWFYWRWSRKKCQINSLLPTARIKICS